MMSAGWQQGQAAGAMGAVRQSVAVRLFGPPMAVVLWLPLCSVFWRAALSSCVFWRVLGALRLSVGPSGCRSGVSSCVFGRSVRLPCLSCIFLLLLLSAFFLFFLAFVCHSARLSACVHLFCLALATESVAVVLRGQGRILGFWRCCSARRCLPGKSGRPCADRADCVLLAGWQVRTRVVVHSGWLQKRGDVRQRPPFASRLLQSARTAQPASPCGWARPVGIVSVAWGRQTNRVPWLPTAGASRSAERENVCAGGRCGRTGRSAGSS